MKYKFNHTKGEFGGCKCTDQCPITSAKIGSTFCQNMCDQQQNGMKGRGESLEYVVCAHLENYQPNKATEI